MSDTSNNNTNTEERSKNQDLIRMYKYILSLPPINKKDIHDLYKRFNMCLEYCENNNIIISNQLVYFWCSLHKDDVYDIEHNRGAWNSQHSDFIKHIKSFCATNRETLGNAGVVNPVLTIFHQKAYDGLTDQPQIQFLPVAVAPVLNQADIIKQFGQAALKGSDEKDF